MNTAHITLHDYEAAERSMAHETAMSGLTVHTIITLVVAAGLIVINITLAPEFPWSAFAIGGMLIGLLAHWWFGFVKLDDEITRQQQKTEAYAAKLQ
jgi:2TM domain